MPSLPRRRGLSAPFPLFLLELVRVLVRMAPDLVGRRLRHGFGLTAGTCCEDEKGCRPQHDASVSLHVFPLNSHRRSSLQNRCRLPHHTLPSGAKPPVWLDLPLRNAAVPSQQLPKVPRFPCHCATASPKI